MMNCSINNDSFTVNASDITNYSSGDCTDGAGVSTITPTFYDWDNDTSGDISCWHWWQNYYYPYVVIPSYPVYIKEKSYDKGEKAYQIIKTLRDKKILNVETVKDFVKAMDELIKLL